jgi:hypothetical protein
MATTRSVENAVRALHGVFPLRIEAFSGTDIMGLYVENRALLPEIEIAAQRIAQRIGAVAPVKIASKFTGYTLVGFSSNPEMQRTQMAARGFRIDRLDIVRTYGQRALYGGAWTCAGASCLTLKGSG